MDNELSSARFATVDEAEFRRILKEKDSKNTRRATNVAVKIFRTYLKAKNMPETFFPMYNHIIKRSLTL